MFVLLPLVIGNKCWKPNRYWAGEFWLGFTQSISLKVLKSVIVRLYDKSMYLLDENVLDRSTINLVYVLRTCVLTNDLSIFFYYRNKTKLFTCVSGGVRVGPFVNFFPAKYCIDFLYSLERARRHSIFESLTNLSQGGHFSGAFASNATCGKMEPTLSVDEETTVISMRVWSRQCRICGLDVRSYQLPLVPTKWTERGAGHISHVGNKHHISTLTSIDYTSLLAYRRDGGLDQNAGWTMFTLFGTNISIPISGLITRNKFFGKAPDLD